MGKGFNDFFCAEDADIFAVQETKLQEGQIDFAPEYPEETERFPQGGGSVGQ